MPYLSLEDVGKDVNSRQTYHQSHIISHTGFITICDADVSY